MTMGSEWLWREVAFWRLARRLVTRPQTPSEYRREGRRRAASYARERAGATGRESAPGQPEAEVDHVTPDEPSRAVRDRDYSQPSAHRVVVAKRVEEEMNEIIEERPIDQAPPINTDPRWGTWGFTVEAYEQDGATLYDVRVGKVSTRGAGAAYLTAYGSTRGTDTLAAAMRSAWAVAVAKVPTMITSQMAWCMATGYALAGMEREEMDARCAALVLEYELPRAIRNEARRLEVARVDSFGAMSEVWA